MATPEGKVQAEIRKIVKQAGGLTRKMRWEGRNGAPDLCVMLNGQVVFIEVKRPGESPSAIQLDEHRIMRKRGVRVEVFDNVEAARKLVAELVAVDYIEPVKTRRK